MNSFSAMEVMSENRLQNYLREEEDRKKREADTLRWNHALRNTSNTNTSKDWYFDYEQQNQKNSVSLNHAQNSGNKSNSRPLPLTISQKLRQAIRMIWEMLLPLFIFLLAMFAVIGGCVLFQELANYL